MKGKRKMNTRKNHEKKRILAGAVRRWMISEGGGLSKSKPAKASKYLHHLKEYYKEHPDMQAIIYCRVSACMQEYNHNLDNHEVVLRRKLKKINVPVIGCFREISSGWILDADKRGALKDAVEKAKQNRNTVVVTTSSDRFLRNRDFTTKKPDLLPTKAEFEKLRKLTCNVQLLTLLHPDMPPKKVRSYQTKWGRRVKGNKGGRPKINKPGYKKKRRLEKLPIVRQLSREGKTLAQISAQMPDVPKVTIWYWLKYVINAI
jgi:hypothetical protein